MVLGSMALLRIGGVSVVVSSKRMQAYDRELFRHVGIEPSDQKSLALKSAVHFRAEFEPMSEAVIVVIARGSAGICVSTTSRRRRSWTAGSEIQAEFAGFGVSCREF
jgi:microcystin degradation protein MlrC